MHVKQQIIEIVTAVKHSVDPSSRQAYRFTGLHLAVCGLCVQGRHGIETTSMTITISVEHINIGVTFDPLWGMVLAKNCCHFLPFPWQQKHNRGQQSTHAISHGTWLSERSPRIGNRRHFGDHVSKQDSRQWMYIIHFSRVWC